MTNAMSAMFSISFDEDGHFAARRNSFHGDMIKVATTHKAAAELISTCCPLPAPDHYPLRACAIPQFDFEEIYGSIQVCDSFVHHLMQ